MSRTTRCIIGAILSALIVAVAHAGEAENAVLIDALVTESQEAYVASMAKATRLAIKSGKLSRAHEVLDLLRGFRGYGPVESTVTDLRKDLSSAWYRRYIGFRIQIDKAGQVAREKACRAERRLQIEAYGSVHDERSIKKAGDKAAVQARDWESAKLGRGWRDGLMLSHMLRRGNKGEIPLGVIAEEKKADADAFVGGWKFDNSKRLFHCDASGLVRVTAGEQKVKWGSWERIRIVVRARGEHDEYVAVYRMLSEPAFGDVSYVLRVSGANAIGVVVRHEDEKLCGKTFKGRLAR